jgi:endonuclease III
MPTPVLSSTDQSKAIQKIASLSDRYCRENLYLPEFSREALEKDWWSGLRLFLNHSFFQGRRDEVSEKVERVAMPVLSKYFEQLDASQIGSADCEKLDVDLQTAMKQGKAGKSGDAKMLVSIFQFVAKLSEKNLTLYSVSQIRSGNLSDHYGELDEIFQVGEKIASFYLRDLVCIYGLDALISKGELKFLQPIDVWVRRVAHRLNIISAEDCPEEEVRSKLIEACAQAGVSTFKFNQGAWYLGKFAFNIVIEHLDKIIFA